MYGEKSVTTTWKVIEGGKEPIIGMDNIPKLGIEIFTGGESIQINRLCENNEGLIESLIERFPKLFEENHTVHDLEVKIELKPDHKPVQQKGRRIPIHLRTAVNKEINKLINSGHLKRANDLHFITNLYHQP